MENLAAAWGKEAERESGGMAHKGKKLLACWLALPVKKNERDRWRHDAMCVFFAEMMQCVLLCLLLPVYTHTGIQKQSNHTSHTIVYTDTFVVDVRLYAKH
jgi:hypothetical protein